jgi:hypothetical protein
VSPPRISPGMLSAEQLAAARSQGALSLFPDPDPASAEPPRPHAGAGSFIGIDCGLGGALAAILPDGSVRLHRAPTKKIPGPDGEDVRVYDERGMARLIFSVPAVAGVLIEKQQAYPDAPTCPRCSCVPCRSRGNRGRGGQGTVSAFTLGLGYGLWRMALVAAEVPWEAIGQGWRKAMGVALESKPRRKKGERPVVESAEEHRARMEKRRRDGKQAAKDRAKGLFPRVSLIPPGGRVEHDGFAEALLLAALARAMSGRS